MIRPDSLSPVSHKLPSLAEAGGLPPLRGLKAEGVMENKDVPVATVPENIPSHAFRCPACGVVLRRTTNATKGSCPSCLTWIEVPTLKGNAMSFQMVHPGSPESKVIKAVNKRLNRTGLTKFEERKHLPKNHAEPGFEIADVVPQTKEAAPGIGEDELFDWELRLLKAGFIRKEMQAFADASGKPHFQIVWLKAAGFSDQVDSDSTLAPAENRLNQLCELLRSAPGHAMTLRDLRNSHEFSKEEISCLVASAPSLLDLQIRQNPRGGPRSRVLVLTEVTK